MSNATTTTRSNELRRPIEGRIIAGVAAGLGNRFSINPWWFRIALILLTLVGGLGLVLYAMGWLLIPEEGTDASLVTRWIRSIDTSNTWMMVGIGLIALAALILVTSFDLVSGNLLLAAVIFMIGLLLYRGDIGKSEKPDDPVDGGQPMTQKTLVAGETAPGVLLEGGGEPPGEALPAVPPPPPPEPRDKSVLGQLTVAAVLVALGGMALLDVGGWIEPGIVHYLAVALGVIGGGLLVGTIWGRARWLIAPGILLVPLLAVASVVPTWVLDGGDEFHRPATIEELQGQQYELSAGTLYLDLTDIDSGEGAVGVPVDVRIGAGEIRIDVPVGTPVVVEGKVGIGAVDLFGSERAGFGVSSTAATGAPPVFVIHAEVGAGRIVVTNAIIEEGYP